MYLENLIAIFEDPKVGAGGTLQRVRRSNGSSILPTSFWNILGISYLERRVFNNLTTNAVDGSISTLSGRSSAVRTIILQNEEFSNAFSSDTFRGRVLNSDDDKFLTRWIYKHGWKIKIQRAVYLETTVEESSKYIYQCLRWVRARFRGNLAILRSERFIWSFPWGIYVIYFCQFQQPMLLIDITLYALLRASLQPFISPDTLFYSSVAFGVWLLSTKVVKMIPHFLRNPLDLIWLPVLILFAYFHSLLNVYALCTLTETSWGGKILEPEKEKPLQKPQGRKTSSVGR
jgi:cellulose synthase/poly-beta-1,6-N-acetylglucosamine synthase-like glycosyltransferase